MAIQLPIYPPVATALMGSMRGPFPSMQGTIAQYTPPPGLTFMGPKSLGADTKTSVLGPIYSLGSLATSILGAYHGYKRNNSVGWAFGWFLFGGIFWPFALPLMFAKKPGFAKSKTGEINGLRGMKKRGRR